MCATRFWAEMVGQPGGTGGVDDVFTQRHFLEASPAEVLATARQAAGGHDVRIGGGPTTIREFAAGLLDHMHM